VAATTVDVGGLPTRVRLAGDPTSQPVLLLHGIGRYLEDWEPQFDRLSACRRVIALDLPGFGFSARPPGPVTLESLAKGALAALDALGEARPVCVIGNSLGGAVALRMLALAPDRVSRLALVNSAGFGPEVTVLLRMFAVPGLGPALLRRPTAAGVRYIERSLYADPAMATPQRVAHALRVARDPQVALAFAEIGRELGTFRGVRPAWRAELLAAAAAHPRPTLIVWGDRDRILPPHHLAVARRAFPHARTHVFRGTGHLPQVERPDEFASVVRSFLGDPPP
jgi:pimeloyl-ACP methyl ester carboxylesterase